MYIYKHLLLLIFTFIIIIIILVLGLYFNGIFEALLVLIAVLQFELGYRQYWLSKMITLRDKLRFDIRTHELVDGMSIELVNEGSTTIYIVGVDGVVCNGIPLPRSKWSRYITNVHKDEAIMPNVEYVPPAIIANIEKNFYVEKLVKEKCYLEISYRDIYGDKHKLWIGFYSPTPIIMYVDKPPGFILSIPEHIDMIIKYIRTSISKRIRRNNSEV